jgi:putative FmdB family regulatory protein
VKERLMPSYEYECQKCHQQFSIDETIGDHARHRPHACPKCGSEQVRQLISSVHVKTDRKT